MEDVGETAVSPQPHRSGSRAANGIAPSVLKEIPKTAAAFPASRSSVVQFHNHT
ncbi:MAG: hypothetical protein KC421_17355 [Anaerolineales bacterium]|nr:hypothetical protein [Anaerolineales bacterium]